MKVTLVDYTGKGHDDAAIYAAAILIFAKSTRLDMHPGLIEEIRTDWPSSKIYDELNYIANTIPSSWEFIDYTFMIQNVTRAFTHQFVRSRQFSFAQQTMRVLNKKGWTYGTGPSINEDSAIKSAYDSAMNFLSSTYDRLIEAGAAIEDARGILPTNIHTNILAKCNLRTFTELVRKRSSPRTQDEYRLVLNAMKQEVLQIHPWVNIFVNRTFERAAGDLDQKLKLWNSENKLSKVEMLEGIKLIDQMRGQS